MYQALYRKYRPRTFDDVAGQDHIVKTLKSQIASGRSSHAYLFVGTRGTGKTTCAKILARAVNCLRPVDGNPCNECENCRSIESGYATDVLEIDAASNNGVDNVRALRDEAVFTPTSAKLRIYIIDEVHMLSNNAFNALLKIIEEPPEHLVFILATTELHKVPATIVSRCQRFSFRRLSREIISKQLKIIAGKEGVSLTDDAAELIARLADGSMRDGISLFDQCSGSGSVDAALIRNVLGLPAVGEAAQLLLAVGERDCARAYTILDSLYMSGRQAASLFDELSEIARDTLVHTLIPGGSELLSGALGADGLSEIEKSLGPARLTHLMNTLSRAAGEFTRGSGDRLIAEIYLALLCDERLDTEPAAIAARLEALENGVVRVPASADVLTAQPEPAARIDAKPADDDAPPWTAAEDDGDTDDVDEADGAPPWTAAEDDGGTDAIYEADGAPPWTAAEDDGGTDDVDEADGANEPTPPAEGDIWQQILGSLPENVSAPIMYSTAALKGDLLTVTASDAFVRTMLEREAYSTEIRGAASALLGRDIALRVVLRDEAPQIKLDAIAERFSGIVQED